MLTDAQVVELWNRYAGCRGIQRGILAAHIDAGGSIPMAIQFDQVFGL